MHHTRNHMLTAVASAVGLSSSLVLILWVGDVWPWLRAALSVVALLLALKVVVAWRADRSDVTQIEQVLRRLAFVDRGS